MYIFWETCLEKDIDNLEKNPEYNKYDKKFQDELKELVCSSLKRKTEEKF